jgi:hypothetical protein
MNKPSSALTAGVAIALAGLAPTVASATGTCYAFVPANYAAASFDGEPPLVLRYIPVGVGDINTDKEARNLGHLRQKAYSLVGKATALFDDHCATTGPTDCEVVTDDLDQIRLMTTIDGTVITGRVISGTNPVDGPGAHMGINMHFLRTIPGIQEFAVGPIDLECTSPQASPTPSTWTCQIRAEFDLALYFPFFQQYAFNVPIQLVKLQPNTARACSVFKDGRLEVVPI